MTISWLALALLSELSAELMLSWFWLLLFLLLRLLLLALRLLTMLKMDSSTVRRLNVLS